jgi:Flp pilus assembly protein TadD
MKGVLLGRASECEQAIDCFDKAIMLKPDYVEAWYRKGLLLGIVGRKDEATACISKAIELDPRVFEMIKDGMNASM